MPRAKSHSREQLLDSALSTFWKTGYHVVSMGDLVRETGVSRAGIYSDFSGKQDLFHACLDKYQEIVVTPAFTPVEAPGAGLDGIRAYLSNLLNRFEAADGFGIGCLVGNTLTQIAIEDVATREKLLEHCDRLTNGFRKVLTRENSQNETLTAAQIDDLARYTMISVQGLWSYARLTGDVAVLRAYSDNLVTSLEARLRGASH
ncbi:TetR/AcrR family transcriptional regulator [uncultured Sulfitobacter sp.]|uniref:TetR/AcrR family transcriptional regulator n=1 Tax=uncultured Sulfitobacter sp. TaxID=191468 RepID=UPI0030D8B032|tara:strand:- start:192260 stop:192868 length:609 start_codon:yes stop_codon:yes gene_type:complete